MRSTFAILLLTLLSAAPATAQRAAGVRATVRVPPILELATERVPGTARAAAVASAGVLEEEVRLRVRSNVPWRLVVTAESSDRGVGEAGGVGAGAASGEVVTGPATAVGGARSLEGGGVEVARSAGRGDAVVAVRVSWPAGGGDRPRLLYSLDELD